MNYTTKSGIVSSEIAKARLIGLLNGMVLPVPQNAVNLLIDEIIQAAVAEARSDVRESMRSHVSRHHGDEA